MIGMLIHKLGSFGAGIEIMYPTDDEDDSKDK
jgi:hypothetical protein